MAEPGSPSPPDDAQLDLLVEQVTAGLAPEGERALDSSNNVVAKAYLQDFERAAAAVDIAVSAGDQEPMPPTLRARIEYEALTHLRKNDVSQLPRPRKEGGAHSPLAQRTSAIGWFVAAACLVLALLGWLRPLKPARSPVIVNMPAVPPLVAPAVRLTPPTVATPPPTPTEERTALLARPGVISVNLSATKDPAAAGVSADVVWDPTTQRGFLRIAGLKPNDPTVLQFEAWIFDAQRDKRYPLAAGLFDAPVDSTEIVVPIHSDLPVHQANAFAVTLEQSGGVTVPKLHHVVVLGQVI